MGSLLGGLAALIIGGGLAAATVVGVVQSASETDPEPVKAEVVNYDGTTR
jgi:hypothetical protein